MQQNPENLPLRDDLAKAYLDRNNIDGVAEQTRYVLQRNPNDARALTYSAIVHVIARQPQAAAAMLEKATQSDPNLVDAWVGVAWLSAQSGDMARAEAAMGEAKRRHPEMSASTSPCAASTEVFSVSHTEDIATEQTKEVRASLMKWSRASWMTGDIGRGVSVPVGLPAGLRAGRRRARQERGRRRLHHVLAPERSPEAEKDRRSGRGRHSEEGEAAARQAPDLRFER